jgi:hypothetical protein
MSEQERESMLAAVEERGSAYLPQVNAFYVREFQMMHAAEDATRFLHHACQGLPHCLNGVNGNGANRSAISATDAFYACVIGHTVAYFGSRVVHPSRPAPQVDESAQLSRAACEKAALAAIRGDQEKCAAAAQEWGFRIGSQIYDLYLAGKVKQSGLRRLFLAHLGEPGQARKVCTAVIARIRAAVRG